MSRRRLTVAAIAVLGAGALAFLLWPDADPRSGSILVTDGDVSVGVRSLDRYSVVYRVEDHSSDGVNVSTERVLVRRPFDARVVTLSGPPPGREEVSVNTYAMGRFGVRDDVLAFPPGPPTPDRRADALGELVEEEYAQERELRRVLDRPCRVYRIADAPGIVGLRHLADTSEAHRDVCIDEAGLVMEEVAFDEGRMSRRSLAVEVDEAPAITDELEVEPPSLPPEQGGSVRLLDASSRIPGDAFWEFAEAPEGLELVGRYAVIPPGQPGLADPGLFGSVEAFVSEVWTDGNHVLVVEQGGVRGGAPFTDDPNARAVEAGEAGQGYLRYGIAQSEIRIRLEGSRFLRVRGTMAPSRLVELTRGLHAVEGGELVVDPGIGPPRPVASEAYD